MSASSLIFFVIFAVWAAYMLKHWVRRREDLATARTVDRFSEAMRMLERRTPVRADVSTRDDETQHTILRPQVSVKGRPERDAAPQTGAGATKTADAATADAKTTTARAALRSPKVKVGALVAASGFLVVTALLAPLTAVPFWVPLLGLLATAGVVVWLRRSAIAARQARATTPARRPQRVASKPETTTVSADDAAGVDAAVVDAKPKNAPAEPTAKETGAKRSPLVAELNEQDEAVFDQEPNTDAPAHAEAELFDAAAWAPVDVPRPTYTMKAKAERDDIAPAATIDETDTRPLAAHYENTPVDELPFDGMALDEDYDELPQVYRAG